MLIWRIITAIILIPVVLAGVIGLSPAWFAIVSGGVFLLGANEWAHFCYATSKIAKLLYILLFAAILAVLYYFNSAHIAYPLLAAGTLFWVLALYWVATYKGDPSPALLNHHSRAAIGLFCLSTAWYALNTVRHLDGYAFWIIFLFVIIWASDIFAYFAGRAWGKTPLAPLVSPKKTMAGFWGGFIGTLCLTGVVVFVIPKMIPIYISVPSSAWFSIALVTILIGILGDLFESLIKRIANVKDSGSILPGHGGILDRIDSLVSALPFYALSLLWVLGA